jgi:hypothetical protein
MGMHKHTLLRVLAQPNSYSLFYNKCSKCPSKLAVPFLETDVFSVSAYLTG